MKKKIELLAPCGNMESLKAAICAGADAVYLSLKKFGARSFASNFDDIEIIEAINYSHLYSVRVYVAINTLVYEDEVEEFINCVDFLYRNNCDAVIIQDIGMMDLVRKLYPKLEIHASTQMHIHNLEGVKLLEELGIKRVVLARETPISLIKEIKENTNVELEVFVHGALCISYSGQCLMSSLIGGRSGNRGTCAQCCRQPYNLIVNNNKVKQNEYLLSTKDLSTLSNIDKLISSGVFSLKIEGRMKRPEYVFMVVSIYRRVIDEYLNTGKLNIVDEDIKNLKQIFNREFTKGFIFDEKNSNFTNTYRPNHMGTKIGKVINSNQNSVTIELMDDLNVFDGIRFIGIDDYGFNVLNMYKENKSVSHAKCGDIVEIRCNKKINKNSIVVKTTDFNQLEKINNAIKNMRKVSISGTCYLKIGKPMKLVVGDIILESDFIVEESKNYPVTKEKIKEQLSKLGNSVYEFSNLLVEMDENIFVPIIKLNELRRNLIDKLNVVNKRKDGRGNYCIKVPNFPNEKNKGILISNLEDYYKYKDLYDYVCVSDKNLYERINSSKVIFKLKRVNEYLDYNFNNRILVGELGSVYKYKNIDSDFSLNVTNSYAVAFLHSIGVKRITLSVELNYNQIKNIIDKYEKRYNAHPNLEVIISSYPEVMISKYNLLENYDSNFGYLEDRFNNKYAIKIKDNLMYIYNYKKLDLKEDYFIIGVNNIRINL